MSIYGLRTVNRKTGSELLHCSGKSVGVTVSQFWQWSASNLLGNSLRGHFAEFLVATALEANSSTRIEWDSADVITSDGMRIEVKSAAYVQAWKGRPSRIAFSIEQKKSWNWNTNALGATGRHSDYYVFCVLAEADESKVDPTNLDQWTFYVVPTRIIEECFLQQKTVSLSAIARLGCKPVPYSALAASIKQRPNKSPEPTPTAVTPPATERNPE